MRAKPEDESVECQCHECECVWMESTDTDEEDITCPECGSNDIEIE